MKKCTKTLMVLACVVLVGSVTPQIAAAQTGIGVSYEMREEVPENGFGVRIEQGILNKLPIVKLGLRAHFSYFSEKNQFDYQDPGGSFSYDSDITDYDYGVTAIGGVAIGFVKPYVGVGIGSNTVDVVRDIPSGTTSDLDPESNTSKVFWNALVGAEVTAVPLLKPFVEYRHTDVGSDFFNNAENLKSAGGRVVFGVMLRF